MDSLLACAPCPPRGAYGLMTAGLGLLVGLAVQRGARYVALLGVVLFAAGQCSQPALAAEKGASLRLIVPGAPGGRPIVGFPPIHLQARARLEDPLREYACPSWRWTWDAERDGETGESEVTAMEPPTSYRSPVMRHVYRVAGKFRFEVAVRAQGREKRATRDVIVLGDGEGTR